MKYQIFKYLLPIAGISLALGLPLGWPSKRLSKQFDERQLIEQGKAAKLSIAVVLVYLLSFFSAISFYDIPQDLLLPLVIAGMMLAVLVDRVYCIIHDAAVPNEKDPMVEGAYRVGFGLMWGIMAMNTWHREQVYGAIQFMLATEYMVEGLCLITRFLYLRLQSQKEGEE